MQIVSRKTGSTRQKSRVLCALWEGLSNVFNVAGSRLHKLADAVPGHPLAVRLEFLQSDGVIRSALHVRDPDSSTYLFLPPVRGIRFPPANSVP
jgi:hypothetical protein